MRSFKNATIYILILLMAVLLLRFSTTSTPQPEIMDYNTFKKAVLEDQIKDVSAVMETNTVIYTVTLKDDQKHEVVGPGADKALEDELYAHGVPYTVQKPVKPQWWMSLLTTLFPIALLLLLFFFMMQQSQGGGNRVMQFGKSKARLVGENKKKVTFADVAGADEVKEELKEVVDFLKYPKKFQELGAKIPTGVLLFGPPGTGKTLLARAVSGEAGVPFFSISGSDFVEMFVGVGASRVRDLFEQAKKNAPCIVFIDEIDAVGRQRGAGLGGGHDEREQTLNQLLVEMDGFNGNDGVIIIAATNRPDVLDPALLRPGRFDRQVIVDVPDVKGREEILKVHVKNKPLADNVDLEVLARRTPGFTGADLANLVNEAALVSARHSENKIRHQTMEDSIERVIAGPEKKSRVISPFEKKLVSYHEAGHAILGHILDHTDPLHKVSIIPRGRAGGYTLLLPKEDRNYMTKSQLLDQVTMLLGGRVAEALVLQEVSTGASNDLERATGIVRKMITELGMSALGPLTFGHKEEQVFLGRDISRDRSYSDTVAYEIDKEARKIIDECYQKAEDLITENMDKLHAIAQALMEKETLDVTGFTALMAQFEPAIGIESEAKAENSDQDPTALTAVVELEKDSLENPLSKDLQKKDQPEEKQLTEILLEPAESPEKGG